uniref:Interleukin family protein n=1 Tax=Gouania willdenowi TaxID=441366 RepID=A0A8C5E462_GOUWI
MKPSSINSTSRPEDSTSMTPPSLLLSPLMLLLLLNMATSNPMCNNQCCRFVESFPPRLKKLREDYSLISDFYEANDDLDTALLDRTVENSFKSPFACQVMNSILDFYLNTVLPTAIARVPEANVGLKLPVESIQQIFDELKIEVTRCVKNPISYLLPTKITLGLYKAMGELDVLFNYIETYLASKRHKN